MITAKEIQRYIREAKERPYDDQDESGDGPPIIPPGDWATTTARAVLEELSDRKGLSHELHEIDDLDLRAEIVSCVAEVIRFCAENRSSL